DVSTRWSIATPSVPTRATRTLAFTASAAAFSPRRRSYGTPRSALRRRGGGPPRGRDPAHRPRMTPSRPRWSNPPEGPEWEFSTLSSQSRVDTRGRTSAPSLFRMRLSPRVPEGEPTPQGSILPPLPWASNEGTYGADTTGLDDVAPLRMLGILL